jgi:dipeptidase D
VQDDRHSLIIKKPASPGYESHAPIILQGHMDMVCEKNADTPHDFLTDPIRLTTDGDLLRAQGTTLGADNGVAVAYCMALMDDAALAHPPLELVLTADEEAGMTGASNLDTTKLSSRRMINLDTSHEGTFFGGCAGGVKAKYILANQWESTGLYAQAYKINIKGLKGGHSGEEINQERGNSLRILGRLLDTLGGVADLRLASACGGLKLNAIPREAEAVVAVRPKDSEKIASAIDAFVKHIREEYRVSDPGLAITWGEAAIKDGRVLSDTCTSRLTAALLLLPNGVQAMSMDAPGLVETSCNIGVLEQTEAETILRIMPRSSVAARIDMLKRQICAAARLTGAQVVYTSGYNPWEYNPRSALRETAMQVYRAMYNQEPKVTTVHAGLECGILGGKIPGLDIVSFGPDIWELHTPDEHMSISSMERVWAFLLELLKVL